MKQESAVDLQEILRLLVLIFIGLIVATILLALLFWGLKRLKRSIKDSSSCQSGTGWTIEEIDKLHESGQLTDKQYRSLRNAVIRSSDRSEPTSSSRS